MFKPALLFQDGMVLQRGTPVPVWGLADPGAEVEVTIQGCAARTRAAADGRWQLTVGPLSVSFGEEMTLRSGGCCLRLRDVQVGEVWLAAGQSNMEFYMRYDADVEAVRPDCADGALRFFDYPKVSYPGQLEQADYLARYGRWRQAAPDQLCWFSAVGYYFARELRRRYDLPVGILGCNWSGTPACAWMSEEAIRAGGGEIYLREYREAAAALDPAEYERTFRQFPGSWRIDPMGEDGYDRMMWGDRAALHCPPPPDPAAPQPPMPPLGPKSEKRPAGLHESMLCQVAPYGVRGILFYQGESDGDRHNELYKTLFPALIEDFRRLWGGAAAVPVCAAGASGTLAGQRWQPLRPDPRSTAASCRYGAGRWHGGDQRCGHAVGYPPEKEAAGGIPAGAAGLPPGLWRGHPLRIPDAGGSLGRTRGHSAAV